MAFRLRTDESVRRGLRRIASAELKAARKQLRRSSPPNDDAIHEIRKSVKKVRTILQLVEDDDGTGMGGSNKHLHRVSVMLSRLRDADAMMEILAKLMKRNPHLFKEHTLGRIRRRLLAHKGAVMDEAAREDAWKTIGRDLQKARRQAKRWTPAHRGGGAIAAGIRQRHGRGRKAMARALKRRRAADFHEWRKEIKALWYQLRLVERRDTAVRRVAQALHRAETWLGDDHNLVVLCAELSTDPSVCGGQVELDRLRLAADLYQRELRKRTIAGVRRLYGRTSRDYARSVRRALRLPEQRRAPRPRRAAA